MTAGRTPEHHQVGWDGLLFQTPPSWHPAVIYPDYLLFEQEYRPVFGLRWQRLHDEAPPEKILQSLRLRREAKNIHIRQKPSPAKGISLPDHLPWTSFSWQQEDEQGEGVLISCPRSRRASLLLFYGTLEQDDAIALVCSFRDHGPEETWLWAIYDIRIRLPARTRLSRCQFYPGQFTLSFELDRQQLTIYRFRPAAELLSGTDLVTFGCQILDLAPEWLIHRGDTVCEWEKTALLPNWMRVVSRQGNRANFRIRFWHLIQENTLLGIRLSSSRGIDPQLLERICSTYTVV